MDINKRLNYISENTESLTEDEKKELARIYNKVQARVEADNSEKDKEEEVLSQLLHLKSDLVKEKMELFTLSESLFKYFASKDINNSQFSTSDLLSLIKSDIRKVDEIKDKTVNVIDILKHK